MYSGPGNMWGRSSSYSARVLRTGAPWDFEGRQPADYIVINIGTNDGVRIREDPAAHGPGFSDAYLAFLEEVRALNPGAHIVCALGPMDFTAEEYIRAAWQRFAQDDLNNSFMLFDPRNIEEEGLGPYAHPTLATHRKMAEKLISHIEAIEEGKE